MKTTEKALAALQAVLREAFDARVPVRAASGGAGELRLEVGTGPDRHRLVGHWVQGWPQDVRALLQTIGRPWPRDHVVLSPRFSPGALAQLDSVGANWGEATGRGRIRTSSGLAIRTAGITDPVDRTQSKSAFRWSPARADVAEILLARRTVPRLEALKQLTGWSVPQIGQTLRAFDRQGWTARAGSARGVGATREIVGWAPLLESWAAHLAEASRPSIRAHATYRDPIDYLETTVAPAWRGLRWCASGWVGLQVTAPFVTAVPRLHLYVEAGQFDSDLPQALAAAALREVTEGERVEIWPARAAVFSGLEERSSLPVVHPTRLYADLLRLGDRARQAAVHIREEVLDRG